MEICAEQSCVTHLSYNHFYFIILKFVDVWTLQWGKTTGICVTVGVGPQAADSIAATLQERAGREQGKGSSPHNG